MRAAIGRGFRFVWDWYYKTNTNPQDGPLSSRSQMFMLVVLTGCGCLIREAWKHEITRDWVEGFAVLMTGVSAAKVWKRGEANVGTSQESSG